MNLSRITDLKSELDLIMAEIEEAEHPLRAYYEQATTTEDLHPITGNAVSACINALKDFRMRVMDALTQANRLIALTRREPATLLDAVRRAAPEYAAREAEGGQDDVRFVALEVEDAVSGELRTRTVYDDREDVETASWEPLTETYEAPFGGVYVVQVEAHDDSHAWAPIDWIEVPLMAPPRLSEAETEVLAVLDQEARAASGSFSNGSGGFVPRELMDDEEIQAAESLVKLGLAETCEPEDGSDAFTITYTGRLCV